MVPETWIRKQTLANAERYITQELKEYEETILGAEEKILSIEMRLFNELVMAMQEFTPQIQINANLIAHIDCLLSFAKTAELHHYIRPTIDTSDVIDIRQGRHPVIETQLPLGEKYVPNDIMLDSGQQQIMIITGPNMAGKSALLRQTALIVLMAQVGSFVPAESARIGLVDKIFTRVGASDIDGNALVFLLASFELGELASKHLLAYMALANECRITTLGGASTVNKFLNALDFTLLLANARILVGFLFGILATKNGVIAVINLGFVGSFIDEKNLIGDGVEKINIVRNN